VVDEVEFQLVDARRFTIVDRKTLDTIRSEQNFQMSGDVSDASAVSIGQMLGANIVITGNITGTGSMQRLSIKALDVRTAQIVTMVRETF
jgi:curli biogenesis system outer membrane secretion channel CsgG